MVPEAEALTESECLALAFSSAYDLEKASHTVLTCQTTGFDVTVYPGQRLMIKDPNAGASNSLPWLHVSGHGATGATGTYQYNDPPFSGIVRIVDSPSIGVSVENVTATFSGSQMTVSGNLGWQGIGLLHDLRVMWYVTDDAGNEKGTWFSTYSETIYPIGGGIWNTFSETLCCGDSGMTTATPYVVQAFHEDGTPLVNVPIYTGSAELTQLEIISFEVFEEGTQTRYNVTLEGPQSSNTQFTFTNPDGQTFDSSGSYNHDGLISSTSSLIHGIWNFKACVPAFDMCVEQNFTISSDPTPVIYTPLGMVEGISFDFNSPWRLPTDIWWADNSTGHNVSFVVWARDQQTTGGDYTYEPATCSPASGYLFPIGNSTVNCTATDESGNVGTLTFDVLVLLPSEPSVSATAYLNGTSPTGRTLHLAINEYGNCDSHEGCALHASMRMPDGSFFQEGYYQLYTPYHSAPPAYGVYGLLHLLAQDSLAWA